MAIEAGGTDEVGSEAAMLALSAAVGDFCYRSDLKAVFRLTALPASTLGNWSVRRFRRGYGAFTDPVTGDTFIGRREELDHWNSAGGGATSFPPLETRTDDPASPADGRMWLRTDL